MSQETPEKKKPLKTRLKEAALELYGTKGYYGTNSRQIAKLAGTSETGLYREFPIDGQRELMAEIYEDCWAEINRRIDTSNVANEADTRKAIRDAMRIFLEACHTDPRFAVVLVTATSIFWSTGVNAKQEAAFIDRMDTLCRKCKDEKVVDPSLTSLTLREGILGIGQRTLTNWILSGNDSQKITVAEGIALIDKLLNPMLPASRQE